MDILDNDGETRHWKADYFASLCQGLHQKWTQDKYTDTKVLVGEKQFRCHRVVLASMSPFFEAMYMSDIHESHNGVVTLQEIDPDTFQNILSFIYSGEDIVTVENVDSILRAAVMLQIKCLKERCEEFMAENVDPDNCLKSWKLAKTHDCQLLSKRAWKHVLYYFESILETSEFLDIDIEDLVSIIKDNDLVVSDEETVCGAVFQWLNHDIENRKTYTGRLFEILRLPLMQPVYLLETVGCHPLVQSNEECKKYVDEAKRYHLLPARSYEFLSARLVQRTCADCEEVIICIGGNLHRERTTLDVSCYGLKQKEWIRLAQLPYEPGVEFAVCTYENAVFISGGSEVLNGMMYFLTTQNTWLECARMLIGRRRHCMVAVGDFMYVFGGYDDEEAEEQYRTLLSIEKFGVKTGTWEDCGYLLLPVRSASASVVQDKIYIFGGIDGDGCKLDCVQSFDTRTKTCSHVTTLPFLSGKSSAIVCNKVTYLLFPGGEILKMDENKDITMVGKLSNFDRCGFGVVQHEGKIFVIGGIDSSEIYDEFITYDPEKDITSTTDHQMLRPLFGFGCVKATISRRIFR